MANTQASAFGAIPAVVTASDLIPILDVSASGVDRNKTVTPDLLLSAFGLEPAKLVTSATVNLPFVIKIADNVAVTTAAGGATDIASVNLPTWCTQYILMGPNGGCRMIATSAAGTLAGATFGIRDGPNGGGNALSTSATGPASTAVGVNINGAAVGTAFATSPTIYLRQNADSANAGTISVWLTIVPLL